jgi:hypothetical protein
MSTPRRDNRPVGESSSTDSARPWRIIRQVSNGRTHFLFDGRDEPEDLRRIIHTLESRLSAQLINETAGPYSAWFQFLARGIIVNLSADNAYWFYFHADSNEDRPIVEILALDLENALNDEFPIG